MINHTLNIKNVKKHLVYVCIVLFFIACQKEPFVNSVNNTTSAIASAIKIENQNCNSIASYINSIQSFTQNDFLISNVESTSENYVLQYVTGEEIAICKDSLFCILFNDDWSVDIQFVDSTTTSAIFWADSFSLDILTELNPSIYAPLTANVIVESALNCSISIEVVGQDGPLSSVIQSFNEINATHQIPILGLYPNYLNKVLITATSNNFIIDTVTVFIQTDDIDIQLPEIFVDVNQVEEMSEGFQLISMVTSLPNTAFMIDAYGKIRWYLDFRFHPTLNNLLLDAGLSRLANSNFLLGNRTDKLILEIDIFGNTINSWSVAPYGFHHSVTEKADGNLLLTSELLSNEHLLGGTTMQDIILELDRTTGTIIKEWDLRFILDETRIAHFDFGTGSLKDWAHLNEVIYDESDNTIILSSKHQSAVVKVDYSDNIKWILSTDTAWGLNRDGMSLQPFLLTAVDENNQPYSNDIQSGVSNIDEFEWNWQQHAIKKISANQYLLFDNGTNRNFDDSNLYSRAVIYEIDEVNMTVKQNWQYGKERGIEGYSLCCSDVVFEEESNHIIWSPGFQVDNGNGTGGKIIEIDYTTNEVLFEARLNFNNNNYQMHRSRRMKIYNE